MVHFPITWWPCKVKVPLIGQVLFLGLLVRFGINSWPYKVKILTIGQVVSTFDWFIFPSHDVHIRSNLSPLVTFHYNFSYLRRSLIHFFIIPSYGLLQDSQAWRLYLGQRLSSRACQPRFSCWIHFPTVPISPPHWLQLGFSVKQSRHSWNCGTQYKLHFSWRMLPDQDIDMIGARDVEEEMQLSTGSGHVIYTGGAKGTD